MQWLNLVDIDTSFMIEVNSHQYYNNEYNSLPKKRRNPSVVRLRDKQTIEAVGKQYVTSILARSIARYTEEVHQTTGKYDQNQINAFRFAADMAEATFHGDVTSASKMINTSLQPKVKPSRSVQGTNKSRKHGKHAKNGTESLTKKERTYLTDDSNLKKSRMCCVL